jgi:hypothetical protein
VFEVITVVYNRLPDRVPTMSRNQTIYGADWGAGNRRAESLSECASCHQLLRFVRGATGIGRQRETRPPLQTAPPVFANHVDRNRSSGGALPSRAARPLRANVRRGTEKPRHAGSGAPAGALSLGGRPPGLRTFKRRGLQAWQIDPMKWLPSPLPSFLLVKPRRALVATHPPRNNQPDSSGEVLPLAGFIRRCRRNRTTPDLPVWGWAIASRDTPQQFVWRLARHPNSIF